MTFITTRLCRAKLSSLVKLYCQTITLDAALAQHDYDSIDFIKLDIEGAELSAFHGMQQTLSSLSWVMMVMEYRPRSFIAAEVEPASLLQEILMQGSRSNS